MPHLDQRVGLSVRDPFEQEPQLSRQIVEHLGACEEPPTAAELRQVVDPERTTNRFYSALGGLVYCAKALEVVLVPREINGRSVEFNGYKLPATKAAALME